MSIFDQSQNRKENINFVFFLKYTNNDAEIYTHFDPLKDIDSHIDYLDPKFSKKKSKSLTKASRYDSIKEIHCDGHNLFELPMLPIKLERLICMNNNFNKLPPLPPTLKYLDITLNQFTELPELPDSLEELHCGYNQISNLIPLSKLPPKLKVLCMTGNPIKQEYIDKLCLDKPKHDIPYYLYFEGESLNKLI